MLRVFSLLQTQTHTHAKLVILKWALNNVASRFFLLKHTPLITKNMYVGRKDEKTEEGKRKTEELG